MTRSPASLLAALACAALAFLAPPLAAQEKPKTLQEVYNQAVQHYEAGQYLEALAGFQSVLKHQPGFVYARNYAVKCQEAIRASAQGTGGSLEAKLAGLTLPSVKFEGTSLTLVLEYLRQKSEEISDGKVVANFIYKGPNELKENTKVTLELRAVPFTEVLRYVGQITGHGFTYEQFAVVVTPSASAQAAPVTAPAGGDGGSQELKFDP